MTTIYFLFTDWMDEFQEILKLDRYKHISIVEKRYSNNETCEITITGHQDYDLFALGMAFQLRLQL